MDPNHDVYVGPVGVWMPFHPEAYMTGRVEHLEKELNELNIKDVEPLSHVLDQSNIVREDVVSESLDTDQILENAPQSSGKHFVVPKVIEK